MWKIKRTLLKDIIKEFQSIGQLSLTRIEKLYNEKSGCDRIGHKTLENYMKIKMRLTYRKANKVKPNYGNNRCIIMRHIFLKRVSNLMRKKKNILFLDEATFSFDKGTKISWFSKDDDEDEIGNDKFKSIKVLLCADKNGLLFYDIQEDTWKSVNFVEVLKKNFDKNLKSKFIQK